MLNKSHKNNTCTFSMLRIEIMEFVMLKIEFIDFCVLLCIRVQ